MMFQCLSFLASTTEWIPFHMLICPSFCLEGTRSKNCSGTEIEWKHEAVEDSRPVLKHTNEWSSHLACCPYSLSSLGHFLHTMCSLLVIHFLLGHLWICMHQITGLAPRPKLTSISISSNIYQRTPNQVSTHHLVLFWPALPRAACYREQQSTLICFEHR